MTRAGPSVGHYISEPLLAAGARQNAFGSSTGPTFHRMEMACCFSFSRLDDMFIPPRHFIAADVGEFVCGLSLLLQCMEATSTSTSKGIPLTFPVVTAHVSS